MSKSLSSGGSACKYIKKEKQCITPCNVVHNKNTKHNWYCKKTKRCSGKMKKKRSKNSKKTKKSKKMVSDTSTSTSASASASTSTSTSNLNEEKKDDPTSFSNVASNTIKSITNAASSLVNSTTSPKEGEVVVKKE